MECRQAIAEIVEAVRARQEADGAVRSHIASCAACSERWEAESELASQFRLMRVAASGRRSSRQSKADLMRQYSDRHWRIIHPAWGMGLAVAAALLITIAMFRGPLSFGPAKQHRPGSVAPAIGAWLASGSWSVEPATDSWSEDGYTPVPYTPPLAPGERLSVMHAELYPAALTTLGVSVDTAEIPAATATVHADVVIGEDGLPRAVRLERTGQTGADY